MSKAHLLPPLAPQETEAIALRLHALVLAAIGVGLFGGGVIFGLLVAS